MEGAGTVEKRSLISQPVFCAFKCGSPNAIKPLEEFIMKDGTKKRGKKWLRNVFFAYLVRDLFLYVLLPAAVYLGILK